MTRTTFAPLGLMAATALGLASQVQATTDSFLTILSSSADAVLLADPVTGEIVDDSFIDLTTLDAGTPLHAVQVADEIWITDQIRDRIDRFDLEGTYLSTIGGTPSGGLDNLRGLAVIGKEVWVSNSGDNNRAPGDSIVRIDFDGTILGSFPVDGSAWFITPFGDEVLVSFSGGDSRIDRFDLDGTLLGTFNTPGEINFIQQTHVKADGNLYAASFSGLESGVYEYDAKGVNLGVVEGTQPFGPRGVWELGDGNVLWTNGSGIFSSNPVDGVTVQLAEGQYRYVSMVDLPVPPVAAFDIKPGSCPNPFNRNSQGVMPTALLGSGHFDVTMVDVDSLMLTRADGVGGGAMPLQGPPGPGIHVEDVGTPYDGDEACGCHEAGGDGFDDLTMKFSSPAVGEALELDEFLPGDTIELMISGTLADGTEFSATDCIRIVGGGMNDILVVLANWGKCDADCRADLDDNGIVDFSDLLIVLSHLE